MNLSTKLKIWKTKYPNLLNDRKGLRELEKFTKENGYNEELKDIYILESSWQKERIRMRPNFRPNIRLATNIL